MTTTSDLEMIERLRRRNRRLEAKVRRLERQLARERGVCTTDAELLATHFKVTLDAGRLLLAMCQAEAVSAREAKRILGNSRHFYVYIHRMRYYLGLLGIVINSARRVGYWIDDDAKRRVNEVLKKEPEWQSRQ